MTEEIAEVINADASADSLDCEGMPGDMSSKADIEIQFTTILQRMSFGECVLDIRWMHNAF